MSRTRYTVISILLAVLFGAWPSNADAHDASAWGGLFRTADGGASWFQASSGKVIGSALAVAVDPRDRGHLLLGTDSGLLGSRNGGRDWELLATTDLIAGAVLAVAVDYTGGTLFAATASTLVASDNGARWQSRLMPIGASPPRALVPDTRPAAFYLLGWSGLFHTDDAGVTWSSLSAGLPGPVTKLLVGDDGLLAISEGDLWSSHDGGRTWEHRNQGLPGAQLEAIAIDTNNPRGVWAAGGGRVFSSQDSGRTWAALGRPVDGAGLHINHIAVWQGGDSDRLILSSDRGLYLSRDAGTSWELLIDNLPGHVEAGPLVFDAQRPAAVYAGFSVTPYEEVWRNAALGTSALARLSGAELAGAAAFLIIVGVSAAAALRSLARRSRAIRMSRGVAG
jgi:photosystem II stability/assembly factor-like uncharacterized protein